jgi:Mn2+/Fe2+ NRAMP family transporter
MRNWNKILGPGILFAATAIGVSHLVQSTSAGGKYGLTLMGFVALALLLKFPFFEFGSRYAVAKGESLIAGYKELHKIWFYVYLLITVATMFFVTGAVGVVTISFMENIFGLNQLTGFPHFTHYFLVGTCLLILLFGKFNVMEKLIKLLSITMLITTVIAFVATLFRGPAVEASALFPDMDASAWLFIIPLMGWMPTAIDLSTWNSLWTVEKIKASGYHPTLKESLVEFNLGYWISALLAFLFLIMGAFLVYGTTKEIPTSGVQFSAFVIELYTLSIGKWAALIVSTAAFAIMFSTFLTIIDGYTRAMKESFRLIRPNKSTPKNLNTLEKICILVTALGGLVLILGFENNPDGFGMLINAATTISFIVAPVIAILNFRLVQKDIIGNANSPSRAMNLLALLGIAYLILFVGWFVLL